MADDEYKFRVYGDTSEVKRDLDEVKGLMESIDSLANHGANNQGFLSANNLQQSVELMRQLNQEFEAIKGGINNFQTDIPGGGTNFAAYSMLNNATQQFNDTQQNYNAIAGMQFGSSSGTRAQYGYDQAMNSGFNYSDPGTYDDTMFLREQRSYMNHLNTKQDRRVQAMESSGAVSQDTLNNFNHDNSTGLDKLNEMTENIEQRIENARSRIDTARSESAAAVKNENGTLSGDDIQERVYSSKKVVDANEKVITQLEHLKEELDSTTSKLNKYGSSVEDMQENGLKVNPARGTIGGYLQQRSNSIAYHTIASGVGFISQRANAGNQLNSNTDDQAINMAYATGAAGDQAVRNNLFGININRNNGYGLEDSLQLEQLALQRTGYNGGGQDTTNSMVNEMERAGNNTGIGRDNYSNLASAASNAGALNNTGDVKSLDQSVTGMNVYARTAGMQQQNAQTLTNVINQTGQDRVVTSGDVQRISAVQGILEKQGGRTLQGQQGSQSMQQWNNSYLNASEGNNQQMLAMMVQSNPQKYGGLQGTVKAEEELSKGLSSNENIQLAKRMSDNYGGANGGGALVLQHMFGVKSITGAQKIAKILDDGSLSESEQKKAISKIQKEGKNKQNSNQRKYKGSSTATRNEKSAEYEKHISQTDELIEKTVGRIQGAVGQLPTLVTTIIGILMTMAGSAAIQGGASVAGGLLNDLASGGKGKHGGKFTIGGKKAGNFKGSYKGSKLGGSKNYTMGSFGDGKASASSKGGSFHYGKQSWARRKFESARNSGFAQRMKNSGAGQRASSLGRKASSLFEEAKGSKWAGKAGSILSKAKGVGGKLLGHLGTAGDVLMGASTLFSGVSGKHKGTKLFNNAGDLAGGIGGSILGGTAAGAAAGSFIPGAGTLVGGAIGLGGSIIGGIAGSKFGRGAASFVSKHANKFLGKHPGLKRAVGGAEKGIGKAGKWAWGATKKVGGFAKDMGSAALGFLGFGGGGENGEYLGKESGLLRGANRIKKMGKWGKFGLGVGAVGLGAGLINLGAKNSHKQGKTASGSMAYQNKEMETENVRKQTNNIQAENRMLRTAKQLLNQAKQQNGIIGKKSGGGSNGTPDYNSSGKKAAKATDLVKDVKDILTGKSITSYFKKAVNDSKNSNAGTAFRGLQDSSGMAKALKNAKNNKSLFSQTTGPLVVPKSKKNKKASHHALGGITNKQQLSYLSENDSQEAVVPLDIARTNEPRSQALAGIVASAYNLHKPRVSESSNHSSTNNDYKINVKVNGDVKNPEQTGRQIAQSIEEQMKQKNSDAIYNNSSAFTIVNGIS